MTEHGVRIDPAIADYYDRTSEETRLDAGAFLLERLRTCELIARHAPPAPADVVDIGGAAGAYALWLAERRYAVHLVDPVPRLVEEARRRSAAARRGLATCRVADARSLPFGDASAALVLLLGPLYHLVDASDRATALHEAARVLRPGGVLIAAGISRFASALDGLARDLYLDERFARIVARDLESGQHRNETDRADYFTTAYFHRPEELRDEVASAGLEVRGLYGVEGPAWLFPDIAARLADPPRREGLLRTCRQLESEPSVIGCSAHLLVVGEKTVAAPASAFA